MSIESKIEELKQILENLKKSINNKVKKETLINKYKVSLQIYNDLTILIENSTDKEQSVQLQEIVQCYRNEINKLIRNKLNELKSKVNKFRALAKLIIILKRYNSNMALDIKTASELATLIPTFDGNSKGTKSFIDAVRLAETIVPAANKKAAIQLIFTKLTGKARDLFTVAPEEYEGIINKLQTNCIDKTTSESALTKLKNTKPKNDIQAFTTEVDKLCDALTQAYIREQIPDVAARNLSKKSAIQTLIDGSKKTETKMMLKVGKFETLTEAINLVIENEQSTEHDANNRQVLQARQNNFKKFPNNRYHNNRNYGYQNNYQRPPFRNQQWNRPRFQQYQNNNHQGYQNFNRNNNNQNQQRQQRMYLTATNQPAGNQPNQNITQQQQPQQQQQGQNFLGRISAQAVDRVNQFLQ